MALYCECPKCSGEETDDNYFDICQNDAMDNRIQLEKLKIRSGAYPIIIALCVFIILICSIGITTTS